MTKAFLFIPLFSVILLSCNHNKTESKSHTGDNNKAVSDSNSVNNNKTEFKSSINKIDSVQGDSGIANNQTIPISDADKFQYTNSDGSIPPEYWREYTISVTAHELHLTIDDRDDTLLTKNWPFTKRQFDNMVKKIKGLKKGKPLSSYDIPDGSGTIEIRIYNQGEIIFVGSGYRGGGPADFSGADVDLSYLIPHLDRLVESTEKKEKKP